MTKDFGPSLDRELDTASPPTAITADSIIHKGRRQAVSRRAYTGVASVIAVALAAGMVFQIGRGASGVDVAGADPSASSSPDVQRAFPLPEVDPAKDWWWAVAAPSETETTRALTSAWWRVLSGIDGVTPIVLDPDTGAEDPATEETFAPATRVEELLVEDLDPAPGGVARGEPQGFTRPTYQLDAPIRFDGRPSAEVIYVDYYPRGSYVEGTESIPGSGPGRWDWRHLYSGCEDSTYGAQGRDGWKVDYTCEESAGPGGERVIEIVLSVTGPDASSSQGRRHIALIYLADGNAVLVEQVAEDGTEPGFTPHQLAALAFSIPPVTIT